MVPRYRPVGGTLRAALCTLHGASTKTEFFQNLKCSCIYPTVSRRPSWALPTCRFQPTNANAPDAETSRGALTRMIVEGSSVAKLTFAQVSKILKPDFEAGKLFWLPRERWSFHTIDTWNTRFAGKEAFTADSNGYRIGTIFGRNYPAHRVLWLLHTKRWPKNIDHINGDRADNRLVNLRSVSHAENMKNRWQSKRNTSGVTGVHWLAKNRKWAATIGTEGQLVYLGCFTDIADAVTARKAAEAKYGFHENHGRIRNGH